MCSAYKDCELADVNQWNRREIIGLNQSIYKYSHEIMHPHDGV